MMSLQGHPASAVDEGLNSATFTPRVSGLRADWRAVGEGLFPDARAATLSNAVSAITHFLERIKSSGDAGAHTAYIRAREELRDRLDREFSAALRDRRTARIARRVLFSRVDQRLLRLKAKGRTTAVR